MKRSVMVIAAGLAVAAPLHAAEDSGFYIGADVGMSRAHISKSEVDDAVIGAFNSVGLIVLDGDSKLEKTDGTFGAIVGYRVLPYLAVEAQYLWLGEPNYRAEGIVTDGEFVVPVKAEVEWDSKGAAVSALGLWPVSQTWDLYARAGAFFAETEIVATVSAEGLQARERASKSTTELIWGAGAGYNAGANWTVRFEYQQIPDVGDEDRTGETDVDRFLVSWLYRF